MYGPLRAVDIFVVRYYVNGPIRSPTLLRNAHYIRQGKNASLGVKQCLRAYTSRMHICITVLDKFDLSHGER